MGWSLRLVVLGVLLISVGFSASAIFPRDHDYEYYLEETEGEEPSIPYRNLTVEERGVFDAALAEGEVRRETPVGRHFEYHTDAIVVPESATNVVYRNESYVPRASILHCRRTTTGGKRRLPSACSAAARRLSWGSFSGSSGKSGARSALRGRTSSRRATPVAPADATC